MTALKPSDDSHVRGVASVRYPLNKTCAHPECDKPTESAHHCFPRSQIGNSSWFVAFTDETTSGTIITKDAIPHVVGLCGSGTTGHHGDLEGHRAWIKLKDGVFSWYERHDGETWRDDLQIEGGKPDDPLFGSGWILAGPLNPQPGSSDGKPKRRKRASTPEERKAKVNTTIRTPKGEENLLPEMAETGRELWKEEAGWSDDVPDYYVHMRAWAKALQG